MGTGTVITIDNPDTAIKLTLEQANTIGINTAESEQRGVLKTVGHWGIPVSFKALCVSATWTKDGISSHKTQAVLYGQRTMSNVRQGGYELEGWVSIKGTKYSCFTSSQLFEIDGNLINVAVIHARVN